MFKKVDEFSWEPLKLKRTGWQLALHIGLPNKKPINLYKTILGLSKFLKHQSIQQVDINYEVYNETNKTFNQIIAFDVKIS